MRQCDQTFILRRLLRRRFEQRLGLVCTVAWLVIGGALVFAHGWSDLRVLVAIVGLMQAVGMVLTGGPVPMLYSEDGTVTFLGRIYNRRVTFAATELRQVRIRETGFGICITFLLANGASIKRCMVQGCTQRRLEELAEALQKSELEVLAPRETV